MRGGDGCQARHSPLTISLLEPAMLILIQQQARHGYTLLADLETVGMGTIHPSVVYRTLREMEALGWIQSEWDTDLTQGPPRRMYRMTRQGEEALHGWHYELGKTQDLISKLVTQMELHERR